MSTSDRALIQALLKNGTASQQRVVADFIRENGFRLQPTTAEKKPGRRMVRSVTLEESALYSRIMEQAKISNSVPAACQIVARRFGKATADLKRLYDRVNQRQRRHGRLGLTLPSNPDDPGWRFLPDE